MPDDIELAPRYYLHNFHRLCDTVEERYGDVFSAREQAVLENFRGAPEPARCLFVRLVSRTGPWFRESRLSYPEIGPIAPALDTLCDLGLAEETAGLTAEEAGQLFTRAELEEAFAEHLGSEKFRSKSDLLEAIEAAGLADRRFMRALAGIDPLRVVTPGQVELVERLEVLFFGNRYQGLTEFVLEDLGVMRYYTYPLEREQRLFADRGALEEYLALALLSDTRHELLEEDATEELPTLAREVLETDTRYPSSRNRLDRLCNSLARDLERLEEAELALALYERSGRHPARERRARIMERGQEWAAARDLCTDILRDPVCEAEQEAAARILPRVLRKLGGKPAQRTRDVFLETHLNVQMTGAVEEATAAELRGQWRAVHFVENSLMNTLFGLAFWEEIFAPVPGVFHHAYQAGPADMYEAGFRRARADLIDARLRSLARCDMRAELVAAYRRYFPCQCHWVDWRHIDEDLVGDAAATIPRAHLLAIFERILFDPRENRRGFPDLLALGDDTGDYCLVEVKGPGDALQDGQKRWLRFFAANDIPAQVAWVTWDGGTEDPAGGIEGKGEPA